MRKLTFALGITLLASACAATTSAAPMDAQPAIEPISVTTQPPPVLELPPTGETLQDASSSLDACPICEMDMSQYDGALTQAEVDGLLLALNDEYHAWAVYDGVIADFGEVRPFINIRSSEANHVSRLTRLFDAYGVPVPENPWIGNAPSFESVGAACTAGVEAEIANAALYDQLYASTQREDVLTAYRALQAASDNNHLRAFQRCAG
jgi:hypothetical protein